MADSAMKTTIWGDAVEMTDETIAKIDDSTFGNDGGRATFAEKAKGNTQTSHDIAMRAVKFYTHKAIQGPEIIKEFIKITGDKECLAAMQPTHTFGERIFWHGVFTKAKYVDTICEKLVYFPSTDDGIAIMPIRKRATLLTIPRVRPDISNNEIESQLCHFGSVQKIWNQTWKEFPNIANGNRLVTFLPSGGKEIPPFIICRGQKLVVSFKGRQAICMRCNANDHHSTDCPKKNTKLCHLCASEDHQFRDCPKKEKPQENEIPESDDKENAKDKTDPPESGNESDTGTITGEDLVIDESPEPPSTTKKSKEVLSGIPKPTTTKRVRATTPTKEKDRTDNQSPKPKRDRGEIEHRNRWRRT